MTGFASSVPFSYRNKQMELLVGEEARDIAEMHARYSGDTREIKWRYTGDIVEM